MSCLFWEPLRPCGGRRGRKAPTKPGPLAPALVWQAGGRRPPAAKRRRPPGTFRVSQPLGPSVGARAGRCSPSSPRAPWDWRVPFRPTVAAGVWDNAGGCGNRCGPEGGGGGAKRPQSRGLWPRLWFGRPGGRRPPAAKRRRPPRGVLPPTKAWANEKGLGTEAFVAFTNAPNSSAVRGNRGLGSLCS